MLFPQAKKINDLLVIMQPELIHTSHLKKIIKKKSFGKKIKKKNNNCSPYPHLFFTTQVLI